MLRSELQSAEATTRPCPFGGLQNFGGREHEAPGGLGEERAAGKYVHQEGKKHLAPAREEQAARLRGNRTRQNPSNKDANGATVQRRGFGSSVHKDETRRRPEG